MRKLARLTIPVAFLAALACGGTATASASGLTREGVAEEAGFERLSSGGWHSGECQIERIYPTRAEVLGARKREERRKRTDGDEALAHVGHGGVPEGSPTTVANARAAIDALGYPIHLEEPAKEKNVFVGRVHGSLGERFAFFLFVNRGAPGKMPDVPGYPGFGARGGSSAACWSKAKTNPGATSSAPASSPAAGRVRRSPNSSRTSNSKSKRPSADRRPAKAAGSRQIAALRPFGRRHT